jgi:DNA-directed RNA polymerase subunit RPC12/RpoP
MIDTVLNLIFRCSHRRLTRPMTPVTKTGKPHGQAYVVCLDCGKQFEYDVQTMHMGRAIDRSHESAVVPDGRPQKSKVKLALLAAVPAGVLLGAVLKSRKKEPHPPDKTDRGE